MSLLRLLTAGKSLVGLRETTRYRSVAGLPRFGGKKETSRTDPQPAVVPASAATNVAAGATTNAVTPEPAKAPSGWWARWRWRRQQPKAAAIPRFNKAMVQGELTLDRVKVLRNDLSDSDLEVVPAKAAVPAETKRPNEKPAALRRLLQRGASTEAVTSTK